MADEPAKTSDSQTMDPQMHVVQGKAVDFAERRTLSTDQMKKLTSMNQPLTRALSAQLSGWLDADINLTMHAAERQLFRDYLGIHDPETMYLASARFQGTGIPALMAMDLRLTDAFVHLNLGGPLDMLAEAAPRELTMIDHEITASLMSMFWRELNQVWAPAGLQGNFDRRIAPTDVLKVFPATEYLLTFSFTLSVSNLEGQLTLSLATAVADTLLREIDRHDATRQQSPEVKAVLRERLGQIPQRGTLRLPAFSLRLKDVRALREGTIVHTGILTQSSAEFSVPGGPVWLATPMKQEGRVAARLLGIADQSVRDEGA